MYKSVNDYIELYKDFSDEKLDQAYMRLNFGSWSGTTYITLEAIHKIQMEREKK